MSLISGEREQSFAYTRAIDWADGNDGEVALHSLVTGTSHRLSLPFEPSETGVPMLGSHLRPKVLGLIVRKDTKNTKEMLGAEEAGLGVGFTPKHAASNSLNNRLLHGKQQVQQVLFHFLTG